jgi:arylsulfatase A-like enzyme
MLYTFEKDNANAPSTHRPQYFEMMGNHAVYSDGWIASTKVMRPPWDTGKIVAEQTWPRQNLRGRFSCPSFLGRFRTFRPDKEGSPKAFSQDD